MTCDLVKKGKRLQFFCGDGLKREPKCQICGELAEYRCDYPVGRDKSCSVPLCEAHAKNIGPNLDYCPAHDSEYQAHVVDIQAGRGGGK